MEKKCNILTYLLVSMTLCGSSCESHHLLNSGKRNQFLSSTLLNYRVANKGTANFCPHLRQMLTDFHFFHRHILWNIIL